MATTIHLPSELLTLVDRRAEERGISRNLYIRKALERVVAEEQEWSPSFLAELRKTSVDLAMQDILEPIATPIEHGSGQRPMAKSPSSRYG